MHKKGKFFLFVFFIVHSTFAQLQYTTDLEKAHQHVLNLEFKQAKLILDNSKTNSAVLWLNSYSAFIEYLTTSSEIFPSKQILYYDENVKALEHQSEDPFSLLGIVDNYLFKAYTHLTIKEYLWAGTSYLKAQHYMLKLQHKYPEFSANYRNNLIKIMADAWMSENLPFVNRIKSLDEAMVNYKRIQRKAVADKKLAKTFKRELKIVGVLLYPYIEQNPYKVFENIKQYGESWSKQGPIEELAFVNFSKKAEMHHIAHECLLYGNEKGYHERLNRLNLFLGSSYLSQLNDSAIVYLNRFVGEQKNSRALAYARLHQAWYYSAFTDKIPPDIIHNLLMNDESYTAEDAQAIYEAKHYKSWNQYLLQARFAFDGGNYEKSLELLSLLSDTLDALAGEQELEYYYRFARINHALQNTELAIKYYSKVIDMDFSDQYYYAAYACFYMGQLLLEKGNIDLAKDYFDKCTETNTPIYKASIHRKAKLLVKSLK